ncbi:uncharacterized protein SCHCODRAFT_02723561 [Schizophyllum commune H4-8]|uniref:uncharacterized protein n=1 Tax=Schizophyllum commune (strain H4-8 / FGSC 9210) TaxID=578458 RepID=UPI00215EE37B|nr:uncharacterized protein SCHCODRAFT_02723561 [Schizophyllum commune H4-8]KAI5895961.1 hypothetical protein SCHCODRAFT_02723561 [Schizophyllum commune H4-8]
MADPLDQRHLIHLNLGGPQLYRTGTDEIRSVAPGDFRTPSVRLHIPPFNEDNDDSDSEVESRQSPRPTEVYRPSVHRRGRRTPAPRSPSPDVNTETLDWTSGPGYVKVIGHAELDIVVPYTYSSQGPNVPGVPMAGTEVIHFYRVPADYGETSTLIEEHVRWPETVAVRGGCYRTITLQEKMLVRIVTLYRDDEHENYLVVDSDGKPCFPPCDENDIWARFYLPDRDEGDIDGPIPNICLERGCKQGRVWDVTRCGQSRYCSGCHNFFHVGCLGEPMHRPNLVQSCGDRMESFQQPYMLYLKSSTFKSESLFIKRVRTNQRRDLEKDIHDTFRKVGTPKDCRWREVAALPIRRRTMPGRTPLTNEVLIQHAREKVLAGHGDREVPDLLRVLIIDGLCPQAACHMAHLGTFHADCERAPIKLWQEEQLRAAIFGKIGEAGVGRARGADRSWGSRPVGRFKKWINRRPEGSKAGSKTRIYSGETGRPFRRSGYRAVDSNLRPTLKPDARDTDNLSVPIGTFYHWQARYSKDSAPFLKAVPRKRINPGGPERPSQKTDKSGGRGPEKKIPSPVYAIYTFETEIVVYPYLCQKDGKILPENRLNIPGGLILAGLQRLTACDALLRTLHEEEKLEDEPSSIRDESIKYNPDWWFVRHVVHGRPLRAVARAKSHHHSSYHRIRIWCCALHVTFTMGPPEGDMFAYAVGMMCVKGESRNSTTSGPKMEVCTLIHLSWSWRRPYGWNMAAKNLKNKNTNRPSTVFCG